MTETSEHTYFFSWPSNRFEEGRNLILVGDGNGVGPSTGTAVDLNTTFSYDSVQDQVTWDYQYGLQTKNGNYAMKMDPFEFGGSDFTLQLIFKFTESGASQTLLTFGDESSESSLKVSRLGADNRLQVELNGGPGFAGYKAQMTADNDLLESKSNPNHNEFVHLVVVYQSPKPPSADGSVGTPPNLSIYINEQIQTVAQSRVGGSSFDGIPTATRSIHLIGNSNGGNGNEMIKVLRFLNNDLKSPTQVLDMFQFVLVQTPFLSDDGWTAEWIQRVTGGTGGGDSNNQPVTATGAPLSLIPKNLIL
jgi:hypothetical protein